jgi:hypothetical protein
MSDEAKSRKLGNCVKCNKELIEHIADCGFWCYNDQLKEEEKIVFIDMNEHDEPIYRCRGCATKKQIEKHDKTF